MKKLALFYWFVGMMMLSMVACGVAQAGVVVGATRLVYHASSKEEALSINNPEKTTPYLIQSWIDNFQDTDTSKVPFIITPPLFRLDAGQENVLRVIYTGHNLPQDRESIFWLNVKSIPSSSSNETNQLQITVKARIKLFYRPENLPVVAETAYQQLVFSSKNGKLSASNPTPYYISFYSLKVNGKELNEPGMIAPKESRQWSMSVNAGETVTWSSINDFGGISASATKNL